MLPTFSYMESLATWSAYSGETYRRAIKDVMRSFPDGENDLIEAAGAYGMSLYGKLGNKKRYFLDKTPRYHLIASQLINIGRLWDHELRSGFE